MRFEIGRDEPVGDEVAVVWCVAEVAAVGEALAAVLQPAPQAVILELPDEPALEAGGRGDGLPVVGQGSVRVAHRVAVLAHDQRTGADPIRTVLADHLDLRVHRARGVAGFHPTVDPVLHRTLWVGAVAVHHATLVVQWPAGVDPADPTCERVVVGAVAALVAETPLDDRRMVPIPLHHPRSALDERRAVAGVVADARVVCVALDVGFIDHIHAQLVAQVVEHAVVRVVARADCGDVVGAHQLEVLADVVGAHCLAAIRMVVVAVHAEDPDRLAVDAELAIDHLDTTHAHVVRRRLDQRLVRVEQLARHLVQVRGLRRPRGGRRHDPSSGGHMPHEDVRNRERVRHGRGLRLADHTTPRGAQRGADGPPLVWLGDEADLGRDLHGAGARRMVEVAVAADVGDVHERARFDVDRAVEAGHPPLVLILDVAAGAVPDDDDGKVVRLAGDHMSRQVVLTRQAAVGPVPHEHAVDVHGMHALGPADVEHDLRALPRPRHGERGAVQPGGHPLGQCRWRPGERHLHVGVMREVAGVLHRPTAGDGDLFDHLAQRRGQLAGQRRLGHDVGMVEQRERPRAVERASLGTGDRHVHRQAPDRGDGGIRPRPEVSDDGQHQRCRNGSASGELIPCWHPASAH